jgi:hypothetical protein
MRQLKLTSDGVAESRSQNTAAKIAKIEYKLRGKKKSNERPPESHRCDNDDAKNKT